nr:hypothetical protein CKG001_17660 [Bdellovibrio sp. CKG001]
MKFEAGKNVHFTIVGKTGSGKSYLARQLLKKDFKRQVIFDPVMDWHDGIIVESWAAFAEKIMLFAKLKEFKLIFRFSPDDPHKPETLNEALRVIYHIGNIQVVIDEIQLFCTPHYMPPYMENLYFIGRHKNIGVMGITQRPSKLNKSALAQSTHVFVGQLHERNDIRVVADFLDENTQRIVGIKPREFIYFSPTFGKRDFKT